MAEQNEKETSPSERGRQGKNYEHGPARRQIRIGRRRRIQDKPEQDTRLAQGADRVCRRHLRAETPRHHREGATEKD